jgi:hypothetical protein
VWLRLSGSQTGGAAESFRLRMIDLLEKIQIICARYGQRCSLNEWRDVVAGRSGADSDPAEMTEL